MVRAKFKVQAITHRSAWGDGPHDTDEVELVAVSGEQNKSWSKWTPAGSIKLQINNPGALNQFKPGAFYFVDFSEAPASEADEKK